VTSEESAEVIRALFAALEHDDFATALGLFDPEVEWLPTEGRFRGIEGVGAAFIEWLEPWDEHHIELEELVEAGEDRALVTLHIRARGEHSGMEIDQRFFQVYTVAEGKVRRMVEYVDRDQAQEAAGLR
jgi:ketosteroid isomerase-like protein